MGASVAADGKRVRVLLVDDEQKVLDGLRLALRPSGCEVVLAKSAEQALIRIAEQSFDLVIADEHMPGESGSQFLTTVREFDPCCACVLLSGRPTLGAALRAVNGARAFRILTKPVGGPELRGVVEEAVVECSRRRRASAVESGEMPVVVANSASQSGPSTELSADHPLGSLCPRGWRELSKREREVVKAVVDGWRVSQIAERLFISVHTVRNHLKSIYRKLDVHSQRELMAQARS